MAFPLQDLIYATPVKLTRDQYDAEDLVQDTYLKAWRYFYRFKRGSNYEAWILRILMNNFINGYRRAKRQPLHADFEITCATVSNKRAADVVGIHEVDVMHDYSQLFDDSITSALDDLPEHDRVTIMLADVNNLKYQEIAEILDCPIGTFMSRLSRRRQMLANELREYAQENRYVLGP